MVCGLSPGASGIRTASPTLVSWRVKPADSPYPGGFARVHFPRHQAVEPCHVGLHHSPPVVDFTMLMETVAASGDTRLTPPYQRDCYISAEPRYAAIRLISGASRSARNAQASRSVPK